MFINTKSSLSTGKETKTKTKTKKKGKKEERKRKENYTKKNTKLFKNSKQLSMLVIAECDTLKINLRFNGTWCRKYFTYDGNFLSIHLFLIYFIKYIVQWSHTHLCLHKNSMFATSCSFTKALCTWLFLLYKKKISIQSKRIRD